MSLVWSYNLDQNQDWIRKEYNREDSAFRCFGNKGQFGDAVQWSHRDCRDGRRLRLELVDVRPRGAPERRSMDAKENLK